MASATGRDGQAAGLGLRLELAQGPGGPRVRLHAGPAELTPGLRLAALVAEPLAPALPRSPAALREGPWRALEARLEVTAAALERAAQTLCGARVGTWPIDQVAVDVAGEAIVLTLAGPRDDGWPALAQLELDATAAAGAVLVRARRVWATGPLAPSGAAIWESVARRLAAGREGVAAATPAGLILTPEWLLRRTFRSSGARPPQTRALRVTRVRGEGRALRIALTSQHGAIGHVRSGMSDGEGLIGHVRTGMSQEEDWRAPPEPPGDLSAAPEPEDPLRPLRAALRAGDRAAALTALAQAPAPTHPGARRLTRALAQVRAELLRFRDPPAATAAVRAWLAAAPDDAEAWWRLVVAHARAGEPEAVTRGLTALARMPGPPAVALGRKVARALVEAEQLGAGGRARAVLEDMSWIGGPEVQAAAWRALAIARAGDPEASAEQVEAAVAEAVSAAARCERRWCEDEELHARVVAAGRRCGRDVIEAERAAVELSEVAAALGRERLGAEIARRTRRVEPARLRAELRTLAARTLEPGALLALAKMSEETGDEARALGLRQLAAFLSPGLVAVGGAEDGEACGGGTTGAAARDGRGEPEVAAARGAVPGGRDERSGIATAEESAAVRSRGAGRGEPRETITVATARGVALEVRDDPGEPRAAIVQVLQNMVSETGGIRAPGQPAGVVRGEAEELLARVEEGLGPLRAATGLRLPVRVAAGGPEGGVSIRNEREPAIVAHPGLLRLPACERRFRLALAAALIRGGLAVVLDPAGASLHELLDALAWLGEPSRAPELPGGRTIVRVWHKREVTPQRFPPAQRAALAQQLAAWQGDRARVGRLATLLRADHCAIAARLSLALDGALLALGRDARLPPVVDEASARRVCATTEARRLLRDLELF